MKNYNQYLLLEAGKSNIDKLNDLKAKYAFKNLIPSVEIKEEYPDLFKAKSWGLIS